jgi:Putative DNA-binding domain/Translation initiation factor IF-2, N-terminal region
MKCSDFMPLRIYDIAKKLGLENKEVISKAKALGITVAKVPSSSIDKITAEFLEKHLFADHPNLSLRLRAPPPTAAKEATTIAAPKPTQEQPKNSATTNFRDDESLAIRLRKDASVEIYSFTDSGFQFAGSFAFQIESQPKSDANKPGDDPEEIILLTNNEGPALEFKPSARWDVYQDRDNPDLKKDICKTVAAFLNTEGGTLLIGIADNARVLGLKKDFATLQKPKADDYLLFIHNVLFDNLGNDLGSCINASIVRLKDKDVCRVGVRRSPRPVYVKEGQNEMFYIRVGNSSKSLPLKAAVEYCKTRWT